MDSTQNNQDAPDIHTEHVKEEFYKWFESRGLLSELRSYMRQLMVKALDESSKNGVLANQRRSASSPKLQAINLLIIDHLFHEDYLYTVSVFSSEARILESLPQYSGYVTVTLRQGCWDPGNVPRFSTAEAEDILDTLRLPARAARAYSEGSESLMTCAVRALVTQAASSLCPERSLPDGPALTSLPVDSLPCPQLWSQEMQELMLLAGVKLHHIRRMQTKWSQLLEEERRQAKVEEECARMEWQRSTETALRHQLTSERQAIEKRCGEVELRENRLASMAQQLSAVHEDITLRMSELQLQRQELEDQEERQQGEREELKQREEEILKSEEELKSTLFSIHHQSGLAESSGSDEADRIKSATDIQQGQKNVDYISVCVQTDNVPTAPSMEQCSQTTQVEAMVTYCQTNRSTTTQTSQTNEKTTQDREQQTMNQLDLGARRDREKINELQEENLELRAQALQQRRRIDELSSQVAQLEVRLEDSRVAIDVLSGRESAVVAVAPPAPPLFPPAPTSAQPHVFIAPTFGFVSPQRRGGGEQSLFTPTGAQSPPRPDGRRRPSRFAFSQNPPSEESSPTDNVVSEARARIRQLEGESAALQRSYEEFHHRVITSDSFMFPPLGTPRRYDPLTRVRRSELAPRPTYASRVQIPAPESSSTDHSPADARIEDVTGSRRLFNAPRNLRQFERWKQFKKKFQRRAIDRRKVQDSSSEEEDAQLRIRRREHRNRNTQAGDSQRTNAGAQIGGTDFPEMEPEKKTDAVEEKAKRADGEVCHGKFKVTRVEESVRDKDEDPDLKSPHDKSLLTENRGGKLNPEMVQSVRLIESVKKLLSDRNLNVSNRSNSSWALDSLPKDTERNGEVLNTENSATVMTAVPNIVEGAEKKICDLSAHSIHGLNDAHLVEAKVSQVSNDDKFVDDGASQETQDILVSPSLNLMTSLVTMNDVRVGGASLEEHEAGERGTTSATSGSDILRELNQSKEESSESIVSLECEERSKNSSDFWN